MAKAKRKPSRKRRRGESVRILIVEARYYGHYSDALLRGAMRVLNEAGVQTECISVPGALEIPSAIVMAIEAAKTRRKPYDGVVALGCVIKGETYHFDIVSNESARGLMDISIAYALPIGNGILTVDNEDQAKARLGGGSGHKGEDAASVTLAMVQLKRKLAERR